VSVCDVDSIERKQPENQPNLITVFNILVENIFGGKFVAANILAINILARNTRSVQAWVRS
jgi:hypothetical protein